MMDFAQARRNMVDSQLRTFDVTDRAVLAAMAEVPRERFVRPGQEALAYSDGAVDGLGRQLLPPMIVARLIQALDVESGQRVLDVAGGGYSAAILARLGAEVVALDAPGVSAPEPADAAGVAGRVTVRSGPIHEGCPDLAPFDAVLICGAVEAEPARLLEQLSDGGRLACLQREERLGRALLYVKGNEGVGFRALFDAAAPVLPDFARVPGFVF